MLSALPCNHHGCILPPASGSGHSHGQTPLAGLRVKGLEFGVQGSGVRAQGVGLRSKCLGFMVWFLV